MTRSPLFALLASALLFVGCATHPHGVEESGHGHDATVQAAEAGFIETESGLFTARLTPATGAFHTGMNAAGL